MSIGGVIRTVGPAALLCLSLSSPVAAAAVPVVGVDRFEPASACGCHGEFLEAWSGSMHAQALSDPIYLAKLAEANAATGGEIGPFCETCHGPVAGMAGLVGKRRGERPAQAAEGVNCDFCHQVTGTEKPVGNSSFRVRASGVKRGPHDDAVSPVHLTASSAFHHTAEFCGMCHDVYHPANGLLLEGTYTEWKNGPYAEKGILCQDCHMTPGAGPTRPNAGRAAPFGVERMHVYEMTFVGGNTALGPRELAEERLRAAARVDLQVDRVVTAGSSLLVTATVTNVGAGHYLPTGLTELRRMWLEVVARPEGGPHELFSVTRMFGTELADEKGRHPAELWEAVAVAKDDRIPPGGFAAEKVEATMTAAPVVITATLKYRGVPEELAKKAGVEVPVTEMASATVTVFSSEEQRAAAEPRATGWRPPPALLAAGLVGLLTALGAGVARGRKRRSRERERRAGD